MPVVPVLPAVAGLDGWSLWKRGRVVAANVTWSVDASDPGAQQNFLLSQLAVNRSYNAIRLVLSAGSNTAGWFDMLQIAQQGWDDSTTTLYTSGQPISEVAANIDAILVKCAQLGLGVILDCHDFLQRDQDDGSTGELWVGSNAASYRQLLQDFWTKTVTRWGPTNWPNVWSSRGQTDAVGPSPVIGYELLNEPNPDPSLTFTQMQTQAQEDNNWWALADKCIKAIRQLDATTPIVVDGIYYADPYGLKYFDATSTGAPGLLHDYTSSGALKSVADARIVYSFHFYGPRDYTHQGVEDGLYAALGLLYPLNKRTAGAVMHTRWHDGAVPNGTTTSQDAYLTFNGYADLLARVQPALDFHTNNPSVPIFVGEFSAVNPALLGSEQVSSTAANSRVITKISVNATGQATVKLQSNPSINFYPQGQGGGAYNDYALAKIENATDAAYNYSTFVAVRIEDGNDISKKSDGSAGAFQYGSLTNVTLGDGSAQVATLTLKPAASAANIDTARCAYIKDVLQMCLTQGFSWGYWAEDGYVADAATIDTLPSGVFIGWRPSPAMSSVLTLTATRRTVSKS